MSSGLYRTAAALALIQRGPCRVTSSGRTEASDIPVIKDPEANFGVIAPHLSPLHRLSAKIPGDVSAHVRRTIFHEGTQLHVGASLSEEPIPPRGCY
jgi:hypothetical protein